MTPPEAGPRGRILVVEDDGTVRRHLAAYLEDCGYEVLEAAEGGPGVEIARIRHPDLVITDLRMPGLSGFHVLSTLVAEFPDLPVLVVSGTDLLTDVVEALRRGAWDYLIKPLREMEMLEHAVERALERAQLLKERRRAREDLEEEVDRRTRELQRLLEERTVLLREVHHRVKNNLQVVSSLVQIKARSSGNREVRQFFAEVARRIRTMALVHDALYQSSDFARWNFGAYLRHLVDDLVPGGEMGVPEVRVEVVPLEVGLDRAVPCALIAHELVSNSLRHAFPAGGGHVLISLRLGAPGIGRLEVRDDGVGLSLEVLSRAEGGMGLQMAQLLVQQLSGTLNLVPLAEPGTCWVVSFPLEEGENISFPEKGETTSFPEAREKCSSKKVVPEGGIEPPQSVNPGGF